MRSEIDAIVQEAFENVDRSDVARLLKGNGHLRRSELEMKVVLMAQDSKLRELCK